MELTRKDFILKEVKLNPEGSINAKYVLTFSVGGKPTTASFSFENCNDICIPELSNSIKALAPKMARVFWISTLYAVVNSDNFKASKEQKKIMSDKYAEILNHIQPIKVKKGGVDGSEYALITGAITTPAGFKVGVSSQKILYSTDSYGFESELEEQVKKIEELVYKHIYEGSRAQHAIAFTDGEDDESED